MSALTSRTLMSSLALVLAACPPVMTGPDGGGGGAGGGGGGAAGGGGGQVTGADGGTLSPPDLVSASAQVAGRTGKDLLVSIVGKDRDLDLVGARVQLISVAGMPILGADLDNDGSPDPLQLTVTFTTKRWVGETLTASGVVRGLFASYQGVGQATVTLLDASGLTSMPQTVPVADQPIKMPGEPCDSTFVMNRCAPSYGCRGTPATCQEGLAPTIARMAFYRDPTGPLILLEGVEPEDDLTTIHFEFQNAQGAPVSIDSDGDSVPDLAFFDYDARGAAVDGAYFIRLQAAVGLEAQVPQLVAKAIDSANHESMVKKVAPTATPIRMAGQACDPRGFDACAPTLACSPGLVGATNNKCTSISSLATAACRNSPVLVPTAAGASLIGTAQGGGIYDAPAGCSSNNPKGRPEGIVIVRLPTRANTLTLTTARPGTNFDTTMYVLTGCPNDSSQALDCSDDSAGGSGSTITLTDLPAGDYEVVVDSFSFTGGTFELFATMN